MHVRSNPGSALAGDDAGREVPLPPYIERKKIRVEDRCDYQTMFAQTLGAVAAPTAGLHFTDSLVAGLRAQGVLIANLTLHVGPGTFLPVQEECIDDVRRHRMHAERYEISSQTQKIVREVKAQGHRVIAVGTTSLRALEAWGLEGAGSGTYGDLHLSGLRSQGGRRFDHEFSSASLHAPDLGRRIGRS